LWSELKTLSAWNLYKYLGHRYIRWIGGYFLLAAAAFFSVAVWVGYGLLAMIVMAASAATLMILGSMMNIRLIQQINNILLAFAGNTLGVWRSYWGEPVVTWDLADSARHDLLDDQPSR
jgi:hypothetical protein